MRLTAFGSVLPAILFSAAPVLAQATPDPQVAAALKAIESGPPAQRVKAADALGDEGAKAVAGVPALIAALADSDETLRWHSARALGAIGPAAHTAVVPLAKQLTSHSPTVRAYAAYALGRIGNASNSALPALLGAIEDKDPTVRRMAVKAIVAIKPAPEVILPVFTELLKKAEPAVLLPALNSLAEAGEPAVPLLVAALKDKHARYWASLVLAQIGPSAKEAAPALSALITDSDPSVRRESLVALGHIGPAAKEVIPALVKGLGDEQGAVVAAAAFALANMGPEAASAADPLKRHLSDRNAFVRTVTTWAWMRVQPNDPQVRATAIPTLVESLKNSDARVRGAAVHALADHGSSDEAVVGALVEALKDPEANVSGVARSALVDVGAPAVQALAAALRDKQTRGVAALTLGEMGSHAKPAVPLLVEALADESPVTRREVLVALAGIGPDSATAVPGISELLMNDPDADVRHSAAYALGRIGAAAAGASTALVKELDSKALPLAVVSGWALAQIEPENATMAQRVVPVLVRGLKEGKQSVRTEAAGALGAFGSQAAAAVPALKTALLDDNPIVRRAAAEALAKIGH